ncbi:MAG TPA: hypothetical protein VK586_23485 [Streptosporangiaceae bacterium]|nr:hypothetical protein [Streptosporangiaceae bacterium]
MPLTAPDIGLPGVYLAAEVRPRAARQASRNQKLGAKAEASAPMARISTS